MSERAAVVACACGELGRAAAKKLAVAGFTVAGIDRSELALQQLADGILRGTAIERPAHVGAVPTTALAVTTELFRDWAAAAGWRRPLTSSAGTSPRSRGTPARWALRRPRNSPLRPREGSELSGRLLGKVCVVTGTGGGMGRATALTFAGRVRRLSAATSPSSRRKRPSRSFTTRAVNGRCSRARSTTPPSARGSSTWRSASSAGSTSCSTSPEDPASPGSRTSPTRNGMPRAGMRSTWCSTSPVRHGRT